MLHFQMIKTLFKLFEFDQSKETLFEPKYNTLPSPLAFSAVDRCREMYAGDLTERGSLKLVERETKVAADAGLMSDKYFLGAIEGK